MRSPMVVLVAALAWCAAALVLSCSSSSSGGTEADVTPYTPDAGTPEEVSVPLDLAINDDVPVYPVLVLTPYAPSLCRCPAPPPEDPPHSCGWYSGLEAQIDVYAAVERQGTPQPGGVTGVAMYFVDETGAEIPLQAEPEPLAGQEHIYRFNFDGSQAPGGAASYPTGELHEVTLRFKATSATPGEDGGALSGVEDVSLDIDFEEPVVLEVIQPGGEGIVIPPIMETLVYSLEVEDPGSGVGQLDFYIGGELMQERVVIHTGAGPTIKVSGTFDVSGLGNMETELVIVPTDCMGNVGDAVAVPIRLMAKPAFSMPDTVSCPFGIDPDNLLYWIRTGDGDGNGVVDDIIAGGKQVDPVDSKVKFSVTVLWGEEGGFTVEFPNVYGQSAPAKTFDGRFADVTGDGLPDVLLLTLDSDQAYRVHMIPRKPGSVPGDGAAFDLPKQAHWSLGDKKSVEPFMIDLADLDGNGFVDVIVADREETQSITLLMHTGKVAGDPDGPSSYFELKVLTGVGNIAYVSHGDLDGNGLADIVVAREEAGMISSFVNSGDAFFPMAHDTMLLGSDVPLLGVGDFTNDGVPDVVAFMRNLRVTYEMDGLGDGYFDQVGLGGLSWEAFGQENVASVLGLDAWEPFVPKAGKLVSTGKDTNSMVIVDLNWDGNLDVAMADHKLGIIQVYWGLGDGTFGESYFLNGGPAPKSLVAAEFNGDAVPDMACIDAGACMIRLFLSSGMGTCGNPGGGVGVSCGYEACSQAKVPMWATSPEIPMPNGPAWDEGRLEPEQLAVGDFDGDSSPDLVVAVEAVEQNYCYKPNDPPKPISYKTHPLLLYPGMGKPGMDATILKSVTAGGFYKELVELAAANLDGDQYLDLAVASVGAAKGPAWKNTNVDVLLGATALSREQCGDNAAQCCVCDHSYPEPGVFAAEGAFVVKPAPRSLAVGKLDSDLLDDLVVGSKAYGTPSAATYIPDNVSVFLTAVGSPWNNQCEAIPSLVHFGNCRPGEVCEQVCLTEDDNENFSMCIPDDMVEAPKSGVYPAAIALGYIDDDSVLDMVVANRDSDNITLIRGVAGDDTYSIDHPSKSLKLISVGSEPLDLAVGDIDNDGWADLVCALEDKISISWGVDGTNFETPFYINDASVDQTAFGYSENPKDPIAPSRIMVTDANADGRADIMVLSKDHNRILFYMPFIGRQLTGPFIFPTAKSPIDIATIDLDQDGCRDIIVANKGSRTVSILINEYCAE